MPRAVLHKKLTHQDLRDYFLSGCKKPQDLKVGVEWEKIGVYKNTAKAIRYSGKRGVQAIFQALIARNGWKPVLSDNHIIALKKSDASITLEPGGQIELSGKAYSFLEDNARELYQHLDELKKVSDPLGIAWLGIGLQPISPLAEIQWVPKKRYRIMRRDMGGTLAQSMMKQTASIQTSIDFLSERDAMQKLRLAMALSPFLTALFANSPISNGKVSGFYSKRAFIWSKTGPERSGIIDSVFNKNFNLDDYIHYALSIPLLFIVRDDKWTATGGLLFGEYLKNGYRGFLPTLRDWELHLTTIFTEARLKKYVEIRCMDCQEKRFGLSVPALIKGLFYDETSRSKAWELVEDYSLNLRKKLARSAAKNGIHGKVGAVKIQKIAAELVRIGAEGLERLPSKKLAKPDEAKYLQPLYEMAIVRENSPADSLLGCFKKALSKKEKIQRILACAAI